MTAADPPGRPVIELEYGITVYPARFAGDRWRAVWYEDGQRQQCQSVREDTLAARLEKVTERLQADALNMRRPGADLIAHYLNPDRLPVSKRWSRKHADTQRRLCERYATAVIAAVTCQDIKPRHMQQIVNAAPTAGEGNRVATMISALVNAGIEGGYLANARLAKVHWQPGDRPLPAPEVTVAGESSTWVDPAEIPSDEDVARLGEALAAGPRGARDELMANAAAYSGLRWGELAALTIPQIDQAARVITVDRKVIEVAGHLYIEAPKGRKSRRTIYPRTTPAGYPLAERLGARIEATRAEQEADTNPLGLIFPSPKGSLCRSSNFNRNALKPAYLATGWRDANGKGAWTWHSLRHVFCTTALFTWKLDPTDVSCMAGHANVRTTLLMYVGTTAGVLDRARKATELLRPWTPANPVLAPAPYREGPAPYVSHATYASHHHSLQHAEASLRCDIRLIEESIRPATASRGQLGKPRCSEGYLICCLVNPRHQKQERGKSLRSQSHAVMAHGVNGDSLLPVRENLVPDDLVPDQCSSKARVIS